jgi:hypothetical protein
MFGAAVGILATFFLADLRTKEPNLSDDIAVITDFRKSESSDIKTCQDRGRRIYTSRARGHCYALPEAITLLNRLRAQESFDPTNTVLSRARMQKAASSQERKSMSSQRQIVAKLKADAEGSGKSMAKRYDFLVEDCKRYFGQWDECDPVSLAILRVVQAQNDFAGAIASGSDDQVFEEAVAERIKAITALQKAIEKDPRGP